MLLLACRCWAASTETTHPAPAVPEESEQAGHEDTEDEKGIIPRSALYLSTQPLTPISQYVEKDPYAEALEELEQAKTLLAKSDTEAASDMALQAYEDLLTIRGGRGKKNAKKRAKIRAQRYDAAVVYVDASIAFIKEYVHKNAKASWAVPEAKGRLEDLRDVAREYEDLNHRLNKAIESISVTNPS